MNAQKISEKIQKLLNLAESANEFEAKAASEKANELLLRYNLSRNDVERSTSDYGYVEIYAAKRAKVEDKFVCSIIEKAFFVKPVYAKKIIYTVTLNDGEIVELSPADFTSKMRQYISEGRSSSWYGLKKTKSTKTILKFYGERFNCEIAEYIYSYLMTQFDLLWKKEKKANGYPQKAKQSYYLGLLRGISEQLEKKKESVQQETGLVIMEKEALERMFRNVSPNLRRGSSAKINSHAAATQSGVSQGRSMSIRAGIRSSSSTESGKFLA